MTINFSGLLLLYHGLHMVVFTAFVVTIFFLFDFISDLLMIFNSTV